MTRFYILLVGENSCFPPHPFSAFERFDCAPARRVPHFVRSVSPDGDEGSALDSQGGRVPLDSRFGVAVSGTLAAKLSFTV